MICGIHRPIFLQRLATQVVAGSIPKTGQNARVANWAKGGKVNAVLAEAFEESVRNFYERANIALRERENATRFISPNVEQYPQTAKQFRSQVMWESRREPSQ